VDKATLQEVVAMVDRRLADADLVEDPTKSAEWRKGAYVALSNLRHDLVTQVEDITHEE